MAQMLSVDAVTLRFPRRGGASVVALDDVSLHVQRGEFVTVIGPSGSGKSSLLFTAGGMLMPSAGDVRIGGVPLYDLSLGQRAALRRSRIGFVFQTFNLIPYLTCLENVVLPARLAGKPRRASLERGRSLIERLGLTPRIDHRPPELSVGERQRAALCRSLVNGPDVLLADEPTGNLDSALTEEVIGILEDLNSEGQTVVMATHDPRVAGRGRRTVSLEGGRLTEVGNGDPGTS